MSSCLAVARRWSGAAFAVALLSQFYGGRVQAAEKPLLEAATEHVTPGEQRPSAAVLAPVLRKLAEDDSRQPGARDVAYTDMYRLRECLRDLKLRRGDYAALFRMVRIQSALGNEMYFVRPALKPYCDVLYGAHLFRYFLVAKIPAADRPAYKVVFADGGDFFSVEPQVSNGLNDIVAGGCTASSCSVAEMAFNGASYVAKRCFRETPGEKKRVRVRCSDWSEIGAKSSRH